MAGEINFGILNTNAPAQIAGSFQAGQEEARQNKLAQLAMRQQEQAFTDDQLVRQAYKDSGGDQNKLYGLLNNAGAYKEANAVQKTISDQQKAKIDNSVNALKLVKHHASTVFANPTMESAMAALQTIQQATGQDQSAEIARLQSTGGNPELIRKWAAGHAMEADKLLPHFQQFSNGAAQVQGVVDPLTGKFTQNGTYKMEQSPDARSRQELGQGGKPPAGYLWNPDGSLSPIPGGPGDMRAKDAEYKRSERDLAKESKRDAVGASIAVIDKALSHPGLGTATGLSGVIDPRNYMAGTDATDFRVVLDQIGGTAFLQAFESLKGGGQITEVEGKKATDAIARLNRAQSDKEFKQSLNDLRSVMQAGYERMSRNAPEKAETKPAAATTGGATVSNW